MYRMCDQRWKTEMKPSPQSLSAAKKNRDITLYLKNTTAKERELLLTGCLMNHYAAQNRE